MRKAHPAEYAPVWGHVHGVPVGECFSNRGELCATNVHVQIVRGIDCRKNQARAVRVDIARM